jgi:type I restriction enzyme S subunit
MSSEVPEEWSLVKLGEIAALSGGTTPSKSNNAYWSEGTLPWATPSDVTSLPMGETRIASTDAHVSERALKECALKLNPPGTVLMTSRATIGHAVINDVPMATNQGFLNFSSSSGCDSEFLCHWLNANRQLLVAAAGGSTFKELSRSTAKLLPIALPPLEEQRGIVEVLRSVDEAIAVNRAMVEQTSRMRAAALHAAFEDSGWEAARLGDLGRWSSGGTPSKADESLWNSDVPWVCPRDMKTPIVTRTESSVSDKAIGGACKIVPKGTLLLVVRGMILAKAIPTATTAMPATYNQDIKAFRPNGRAVPKFVQLCIQHQEYELLKLVNTATHGTKKLDAQTITEIEIPLPALPIQLELADAIADMDLAMVRGGEEHIRLTIMRSGLRSDLLSGRVRVPVPLTTTASARAVQPAFKRAVFAAEVVHQLHRDHRFGSVKHEKIVYICELHLGLQNDLDRHAYKEAAGPYDPSARRSVERIFRQQKWFDPTKQDKRIVYLPLEASGGHARYFDRYFGDRKAEVQNVIDLLRPLTTPQCEIVATLYAVWNDFLIEGHQPSDDEIVNGVLTNWTDSKRQVPEEKWRAALPWMREKKLVPAGRGEKTRVAVR